MLGLNLLRRRAVAVAAICIAMSRPALAATFAPTAVEIDAMDLHERDAHLLRERLQPQVDETGRVFYEIDDMRFDAEGVATDSAFIGRLWPGGVLYYQFNPDVNATRRQQFRDAAAAWAAVAPVTFVEGTGNGNWVQVKASTVNNSYVGMRGGAQDMNIASWNTKFVIAHEIGHALGLIHEHSRSDRNTYVTIFTANIQAGHESNFDLINWGVRYGAYDFDSVMHYSAMAFSRNGQNTIAPTAAYSSYLYTMGQTSYLSGLDAAGMAQRYSGAVQPVPNDHFGSRETLAGSIGSVTRNTMSATKEPGEPNHALNAGGASIWFTWRAPAGGAVTIDTLTSDYDTTLHVYTGSSLTGLTTIAHNDDIVLGQEVQSRVTFTAVAGQTYVIAVDGWDGDSGTVTLNWNGPRDARAKADFNGDSQPDLLWQDNSNGSRGIWFMNGPAYAGERFLPTVATQWQIAATGDFNSDGHCDIVWQNSSTGQRGIWLMNGTTWVGERFLPTIPTEWQIAGAGDFNSDGHTDLLWQNESTGQRGIWLMNGLTWAGERFLPTIPTEWQIAGTGHFNSDNHLDIIWQNRVTGQRGIWLMNGTSWAGERFLPTIPLEWQIVGAADVSWDGQTDIIWQNTVTGQRGIWLMNGTTWAGERFLPVVPTQWDIRNR
jgi:hypothetical protein